MTEHMGIDKISFTGSTTTGRRIVDASKGNLKRLSLELGGKSANIIFPDADIEAAIGGSANGIFFNAGQACAAGSRLYVHENVYDEVVAGIAEVAKNIKVGDGIRSNKRNWPAGLSTTPRSSCRIPKKWN